MTKMTQISEEGGAVFIRATQPGAGGCEIHHKHVW